MPDRSIVYMPGPTCVPPRLSHRGGTRTFANRSCDQTPGVRLCSSLCLTTCGKAGVAPPPGCSRSRPCPTRACVSHVDVCGAPVVGQTLCCVSSASRLVCGALWMRGASCSFTRMYKRAHPLRVLLAYVTDVSGVWSVGLPWLDCFSEWPPIVPAWDCSPSQD